MISVILKDGSKREIESKISSIELAKQISEGLARNMTAVMINGEVKDLRYILDKDGAEVEILTFDNSLEREESILAYNITYNGASSKKTIPKCKTCNRAFNR